MSSTTLDRKSISRRSFFSAAAGAAGALTALKSTVASATGLGKKKQKSPIAHAPAPLAAPVADPAVEAKAREVLESSRFVDASTLQPANDEVLRAVGALKPGTDVYGWKVVAVYGVHLGAIPVIMQDKAGGRFQVDVCARDAAKSAPKAVTSTRSLSLYLANGGDGRHPSEESHGLGAMALGTWLSNKPAAAFRPAGLLTLRERNASHPHGAFNVSV